MIMLLTRLRLGWIMIKNSRRGRWVKGEQFAPARRSPGESQNITSEDYCQTNIREVIKVVKYLEKRLVLHVR